MESVKEFHDVNYDKLRVYDVNRDRLKASCVQHVPN